MRLSIVSLIMVAAVGLAACGSSERDISMRLMEKPGQGPDELSVLPSKPLQSPEGYESLPEPAPGATNLTDRNPTGEGIAALGGNPSRLSGTGVPSSDAALVQHASRGGVDPNIRAELAAEDKAFRKRKSRFTGIRLVKTDRYAQAYQRQTLDAYDAWYNYRRTGARTPAAPPYGE